MSRFAAPVVPYCPEPHPNASSLELAVIDGWRAVCRIGDFDTGQKVAYIPEGAVLPHDLVEEMGLANPPRLAGPDHDRVKAVNLRGVLSQGLVYGGNRISGLSIGDDAVGVLGLTKWSPEIPEHMLGTLVPGPKVTYGIDDIQSWPDRLRANEFCVLTEKLHGVFCCLGMSTGDPSAEPEAVVSSRGHLSQGRRFDLSASENAENLYVQTWHRHAATVRRVFDALRQEMYDRQGRASKTTGWPMDITSDSPFTVLLFGEVCGRKVQDLDYGLKEPQFRLFDIYTSSYGYEDWSMVDVVAKKFDLETVPVLHVGRWDAGLLDVHTEGQSTIAAHPREGIVIRPAVERHDSGSKHESGRGPGRVIFRSLSAKHLLRDGGTEYT